MKKFFAFFLASFLSACAGRTDKNPLDVQAVPVVETLSEKVQKLITAQQDAFLKALPEKIDALRRHLVLFGAESTGKNKSRRQTGRRRFR